MAREVPIPKDLEVLNSELGKATIVIGNKAYEMLPLYEGQLERITLDIENLYETIFTSDMKCPKCSKVIKSAGVRKVFECPDDKTPLEDMRKSPLGALLSSSKIPEWVEMITGIPKAEVQANMTLSQMKHFAGVFWKQNFSDDFLPEESKENFKKLLVGIKMGSGAMEEKKVAPAAKTESPSL